MHCQNSSPNSSGGKLSPSYRDLSTDEEEDQEGKPDKTDDQNKPDNSAGSGVDGLTQFSRLSNEFICIAVSFRNQINEAFEEKVEEKYSKLYPNARYMPITLHV